MKLNEVHLSLEIKSLVAVKPAENECPKGDKFHPTEDAPAVMEQDPSGDNLLQDQAFSRADLAAEVFPLGAQDAPGLLLEILGPR